MSYYIYLDESGKEIKREEKGRGKPKKDAVKKDDGNFYITQGKDIPVTKVEIPNTKSKKEVSNTESKVESKTETPNTESNSDEPESIIDGHFKVRKTNKKTTVKNILDNLHYSSKDYFPEEHKITILRPASVGDIGIDNAINPNGVYGKIEINLTDNIIYVWSTYWELDRDGNPVRPDFIIKNALDIKSSLVSENLA